MRIRNQKGCMEKGKPCEEILNAKPLPIIRGKGRGGGKEGGGGKKQ